MRDEVRERLRRRLAEDSRDREAWGELAVAMEREARPPDFVRREEHLPVLLELLREESGDRRPVGALGALLGLELVTGTDPGALPAWEGRAVAAADHLYDPETGLPLRWRRLRDGGEMVLVRSGKREYGPWQPDIGRLFLLDVPPMDEMRSWTGDFLADSEVVTPGRGFRLVLELSRPPRDETPWDGIGPEEAVEEGADEESELLDLGLDRIPEGDGEA